MAELHTETGQLERGPHAVGREIRRPVPETAAVADAHAEGALVAPDEPHERPEDWGWHADLHKLAHLGGWFTVVSLLLMLTATHYNGTGSLALLLVAALVVVGLIWDRRARKNAWRR